jgi:isopenicillin N synthase-like dioxygenase
MKSIQYFDGIPGLDLGSYMRGEPGAIDDLAGAFREMAQEVGFLYIDNHGVPPETIERAFAASKRFHTLSQDRKREIPLNRDNVGYMGLNASMQKHSKVEIARKPNYNESFFAKRDRKADDPDVLAGKPFRGLNQWPRDLPGFREDVLAYQNALERLGMQMLPVVARSLELPDGFFDSYFDPAQYSLRMLHYPVRDESEPEQFGAGAHTDGGFLTFLIQNGVGGLQVRKPDGSWLDAPVLPGKYLVNSGDMMRRWTNERYLSTPHRVMNVSGVDRYSMAFFFDPHPDRVMTCLPTCTDVDRPPKYVPITYGEYLTEFLDANYFHRKNAEPA